MELREERIWAAVAFLLVSATVLVGIQGFGIWDPWELGVADLARQLGAGEAVTWSRPAMGPWLVSVGFSLFDVREWAGRLPVALTGICTAAVAYALVSRFAGRFAGTLALVVAGTTPLLLFNSRQMLGEAPSFLAQGLVALTAMGAAYRPAHGGSDLWRWLGQRVFVGRARFWACAETGLWLGALGLSLAFAFAAGGALLGALPPLLAVAVTVGVRGDGLFHPSDSPRQAVARYAVWGLAAAVVLGVVMAVVADVADYSLWLGGKPQGGNPPTFEVPVEAVFHAFAPWSALLPLAFAVAFMSPGRLRPEPPEADAGAVSERVPVPESLDGPLRTMLLLWAFFGYGALMLFRARYGDAAYGSVVALAGLVALLLSDVQRSARSWWPGAVVATLLTGLVLRDFALYPGGPVQALAVSDLQVPDVFHPRLAWVLVLGLFAATATLSLGAAPHGRSFGWRATRSRLLEPYQLIRTQWRRGLGFKVWLVGAATLLVAMLGFGVVCFVLDPESAALTSIALRVGRRLFFLPLVLPLAVAAAQGVLFLAGRLGRFRLVPILLAGLLVGAYSAQGYLPALSEHFSPREVYDTFNSLADDDETLGEYRVGSRAAAYYARGEVSELRSQAELVNYLSGPDRRWAAFPADELAQVNRAFRRRNGRHLFVADARSARVVLATNQAVEGREDENFIAEHVVDQVPAVQVPVGGIFNGKIELVGYDLELPHQGYVGAGESFTITWVFKVLGAVPGSYKAFVHIDGRGLRLNGDHDPVDGRYPVRLWDQGDVVIDRQEFTVPANYRPGPYTILVGFFAGGTRLDVADGPVSAGDNRVRAGILTIR